MNDKYIRIITLLLAVFLLGTSQTASAQNYFKKRIYENSVGSAGGVKTAEDETDNDSIYVISRKTRYDYAKVDSSLLGITLTYPESTGSTVKGTAKDDEDRDLIWQTIRKNGHMFLEEKKIVLTRKQLPELYRMAEAKKALRLHRSSYFMPPIVTLGSWFGGSAVLVTGLAYALPNTPEVAISVIVVTFAATPFALYPIYRAYKKAYVRASVRAYNTAARRYQNSKGEVVPASDGKKGFATGLDIAPTILTPRSLQHPMPRLTPGMKLRFHF